MKKTLVAVAVLGSFGAFALADSNVTLYGVIDESVMVSKADKGGTIAEVKSGLTAGSRWGIRGVEDLGGGNAVGFILEQGFDIDTGKNSNNNRQFHRESALFVQGGWGKLTMGRLGTLGFAQSTAILRGAIFGTTYGPSQWGNQDQNFSRVDNAVAYKTPNFGGFSGHVMYSNGIDAVAATSSGDDSSQQWSMNSHYYGIGGLYEDADIKASMYFEGVDNKDVLAKYHGDAQYHLTIGGSWKLGAFTPQAIYQYAWGAYRQHAAQIGATADVAGGTAMLGFKYVNRNGDDQMGGGYDNANMWNVGAAYAYPLSKRTKVYGYAGYSDGSKGWGDAKKADVNFNGWAVALGMVHNF